ncbi:MAG: efflux RND transporter periplasmic adaptor subunit [Deltaproteobacteria bacterium]|nr:efflux RND transporter periplasmic adaptor subunit [Deltaproteobacteria bacterium]
MKRLVTTIIALAVGAAVGSAVVFYYSGYGARPEAQAVKARAVLYYRNPMNPSVTSPVPAKDNMGMDYAPVYADEAVVEKTGPGIVRISAEKIQRIGVKSEPVARRDLRRVIRTVGRVEPVEENVFVINAKVSGWVEKLYVNRTDQMVNRGEKLLELYSPDLVSAQEEYLLAWNSLKKVEASPYPEVKKGADALVEAARLRLKYWDISDDQIARLARAGKPARTMTINAPSEGSVTEKMVVEGQKIEAGETLFKIIDHSAIWVYGEVYEYELPYIKTGDVVTVALPYASGERYKGRIEHVYSHMGSIRYEQGASTEVRTAKVRIALPNKDHRLKLGMYLDVEIPVEAARDAVAVPKSALIDTGTRQLVIVDRRDGTFEVREVKAGARADDYSEIKSGIRPGEWVVTSASFLIDSESSLNAVINGMSGNAGKEGASGKAKTDAPDKTKGLEGAKNGETEAARHRH